MKHVLFIQGAGEGAYEEDAKLAASLQEALGMEYQVIYPRMPNEASPKDKVWMARISKELVSLEDRVTLVGHSAGGAMLLKYLLKEKAAKSIAGIFFLAIPYWDPEDEKGKEYTLQDGFAAKLPGDVPIFFYHSRDDEWVPFAHLERYAERVPQATIRKLDGRGHQFNNDLSEIAEEIRNLTAS